MLSRLAFMTFLALPAAMLPGLANAGVAADKAAAAEALIQQAGKAKDALQAFDEAIDAFCKTLPLTLREVAFADSVIGYRQYAPRAGGAAFHPGDDVLVYVALAGYAFRRTSTGYRVDLSTAVQIRSAAGMVIARNDDLGQLTQDMMLEKHDLAAAVPVTLPYLKPGSYVLRVAIRDNQNGKLGAADLPFTVVPFAVQ